MSTVTQLRALGDPAKGWWTYADLAEIFGLSIDTLRRRMAAWEQGRDPFPAPLPWSRCEKRWHPHSVIAWKGRRETALGAAGVALTVLQGGRA